MRHLVIALAGISLCGCSFLETDVQRGYAQNLGWNTASTYTTADVRIVTQREHPVMHNQVVCTEPSPDVAKALATSGALTAQGGNGAASGSLGVSGASAEALAELAGRSTALLGLRDGLYRACEAYANGVIGQDAYALVMSRYAQLMTTLFLGQDITGSAGPQGTSAAVSAALQAAATPPAGKGAATDPAAANTGNAAQVKSDSSPAAQPQAASTASLALVRMNEDYLHLGVMDAIIVGCVNEGDPTRYRPTVAMASGSTDAPRPALNEWLHKICTNIDIAMLTKLETAIQEHQGKPVDPVAVAAQPTSTSTKPPTPAKPAQTSDPAVKAVQVALQKQTECPGAYPGTADGVDGEDTQDAVRAYQKCKGLTVNGVTKDTKTMEALGVKAAVGPAPSG